MNAAAISFVLLIASMSLAGCMRYGASPRQDWREPNAVETEDQWRALGKDKFLMARGSFTGTGKDAVAKILVKDDGSSFGLFVFSAAGSGGDLVFTLLESKDTNLMHSMGIETVGPGNYVTACGKGYWECGKEEAENVVFEHDAVKLFKYEGHSSFFYWDVKTAKFKRIWISD